MYITKFEDCGYNVLEEEYFIWLCAQVDADGPDKGYMNLMHELYEYEFSEKTAKLVGNDENRIEDGLYLRTKFLNETEMHGYLNGPCSVLEFLIALACRMEDVIGYEDAPYWFWVMMRNCGLNNFNDNHTIKFKWPKNEVIFRVDNILNRKYDRYGFISLFPNPESSRDLRRTEIWYQMQTYLVANYM